MSEPLNIEALLQTGYFTTSRAKTSNTQSSTPPLTPSSTLPPPDWRVDSLRPSELPVILRRPQKPPPPPPSVEDEITSLAREHGSPDHTSEPEPPSKGDFEQNPVIVEVHEHNPERRFVIVPIEVSEENAGDASPKKIPEEFPSSDEPSKANAGRRYEPVIDEKLAAPQEDARSRRRQSRHDLPPLDTHTQRERLPEHHRTRSAVGGARPDNIASRPKPPPHEDLLSPEIIKHGSARRERANRDYPAGGPIAPPFLHRRSYSNLADDRGRESVHRRESLSPGPGARSTSNIEARPSRRRVSNERLPDSRMRDEYKSGARETYKRPEGDRPMVSKPTRTTRREDTGSSDDYSTSSRGGERRRRRKSVVIQQEPDPVLKATTERQVPLGPRSRSRGPTMPIPSIVGGSRDERNMHPRNSVTFPITSSEREFQLPYPDEDPMRRAPIPQGRREQTWSSQDSNGPTISMPDFPAMSLEPDMMVETPTAATPTPASWQPAPFDPEKDGVAVDANMGHYRRYSEGREKTGVAEFPECPRKVPVAGRMDWLTLPRTDFNICPECYGGVFANTEYRTQFQPMLRPTDKPVACDFGSSPWYRIAWLLTIMGEKSDLRLFFQVANVGSASRGQPCPGARKAVRPWFTIRDPRRRPVPNFTVCYQCAKTVEALLPNMAGVFVPLDGGSEAPRSICALHFTPKRKRFALYFDALETTAHRALSANRTPNLRDLAAKLEKLSSVDECREDSPVPHGYWHTMQFIPSFTVCGECFEEVVRPKLRDDTVIARNFLREQQQLEAATCQLYSDRMREIFKKACRRNDHKYLAAKVIERLQVEADIHGKLVKLDRAGHDEAWTEEQVSKLISEWKRWE